MGALVSKRDLGTAGWHFLSFLGPCVVWLYVLPCGRAFFSFHGQDTDLLLLSGMRMRQRGVGLDLLSKILPRLQEQRVSLCFVPVIARLPRAHGIVLDFVLQKKSPRDFLS